MCEDNDGSTFADEFLQGGDDAINAGCIQVQGTFNGLGERCGNADLCTLMAILNTKLGIKTIPDAKIKH